MTAGKALLGEILDHPDDDLPRLVYADWLDEHGDPGRAEFIRVQIERARLPEDDPRRADLEDREAALLLAHEERWRQELPEGVRRERDSKPARMFRRGFVVEVRATAEQFLACA